jgi:predicted O-methyltransferase YrrM
VIEMARERLQFELSHALEGVEGWLQHAEAWALFEAARVACPATDPAQAVEIGSFKGRSAIALASGLRARGGGRVVAIDPFDLEPGQQAAFDANVERAGLSALVEAVPALSHEARPKVEDHSVTVLFVDGSHDYEDVMQDVRIWEPSLIDGAVAAFNDPFWSGVSRALRDTVARRGSPFRRPRWIVNTMFFDYRPSTRWTTTDELYRLRLRAFLRLGRIWYRFHSRIEHDARVPSWLKRFQLRVAGIVFKALLPVIDERWAPANV